MFKIKVTKQKHQGSADVVLLLSILLTLKIFSKALARRCSVKNVFLKLLKNSPEKTCSRFFNKNETLAQVFSNEFCTIFKNNFFKEHLWTTTSIFHNTVSAFSTAEFKQVNSGYVLTTEIFVDNQDFVCHRESSSKYNLNITVR